MLAGSEREGGESRDSVVAAGQEEERKPQKVHGWSEVPRVGVTEEDAGSS